MSNEVLGCLERMQSAWDRQSTQVTELLGSVNSTTRAAAETARLAAQNPEGVGLHHATSQALQEALTGIRIAPRLVHTADLFAFDIEAAASHGSPNRNIELF